MRRHDKKKARRKESAESMAANGLQTNNNANLQAFDAVNKNRDADFERDAKAEFMF